MIVIHSRFWQRFFSCHYLTLGSALCGLFLGHVIRRRYTITSAATQNKLIMCSLCGTTVSDEIHIRLPQG